MRYVHLPAGSVDTQLLEDATRRGKVLHPSFSNSKPEVSCKLTTFADEFPTEAASQQAKAK